MDSCAVHETAAIKEALANHGTKALYIQRGFTSRLQVLDLGVNKPFKHYMRQQFETFMLSNGQNNCTIAHQSMGDWILGENYKGNHNEHAEVNRLLKQYYEKDIPYFRTTTLSFST